MADNVTVEDLSFMSTDSLLEIRETWKQEGRCLLELASKTEFVILQRLQEQGATVYASDLYEAKITPPVRSYSYDLQGLTALQPLLRNGEYEQVVKTETVIQTIVDKRALNALTKRGGEIARVIQEATTTHEGSPGLKITRLEEAK